MFTNAFGLHHLTNPFVFHYKPNPEVRTSSTAAVKRRQTIPRLSTLSVFRKTICLKKAEILKAERGGSGSDLHQPGDAAIRHSQRQLLKFRTALRGPTSLPPKSTLPLPLAHLAPWRFKNLLLNECDGQDSRAP